MYQNVSERIGTYRNVSERIGTYRGGARLSWQKWIVFACRGEVVLAKRIGAERGCLGGTRLSWRKCFGNLSERCRGGARLSWRKCFGFKSNEGVSEGVSEGVN